MIRILVVDDEKSAQNRLLQFVGEEPDFETAGVAATGVDALRMVKDLAVDVVFLDIDMPGMNGLEVAGCLSKWKDPPLVVFATAYDTYALKAFEAHALDYVLKPYDGARMKEAFARVREQIRLKTNAKERLTALDKELVARGTVKKVIGRKRNSKDKIMIDPEEVLYFHALNTEVTAWLADKELIINMTLEELEEVLDPTRFFRSHRAFIVNVSKIEKVVPLFNENFEVIFRGFAKAKIPLSRRYAKGLKTLLGGW